MYFKTFIISFVILFYIHCDAQDFTISNTKMNVVFVGIDNPIKVSVSDNSTKNLIVKVNQGTISGENGNYIWQPTTPTNNGLVSIYIKQEDSEQLIASHIYRVKLIPNPVTKRNDWHTQSCATYDGSFSLTGLVAVLDNFPFDVQFDILSFKITVVRDDNVFFEAINKGGRFQGQVTQIIQMVEAEDIVYFSEVKCRYIGDGIVREINDLIFKIRQ